MIAAVDYTSASVSDSGALVAILGTLVVILLVVVRTYGQAKAANRAVNNVGPGEHSLWDRVEFIHEDVKQLVAAQDDFSEKGWRTLPDDISTASRLTETIRDLQHSAKQNQAEHEQIISKLDGLLGADERGRSA
jgi:hypothetical protein